MSPASVHSLRFAIIHNLQRLEELTRLKMLDIAYPGIGPRQDYAFLLLYITRSELGEMQNFFASYKITYIFT